MTTTEHLLLIESKCEANLDYLQLCRSGGALITKIDLLAEAGWKSTLAVIDHVLEIMEVLGQNPEHPLHVREQDVADAIALKIIAAWPIELLL